MRPASFAFLLLVALAATGPARAHDVFEITAAVRPGAAELVIDVVLGRSTALSLVADGRDAPTFDPVDFPRHRDRILARAPALFEVRVDGRSLPLLRADVGLGIEQEVEYRLAFARPPAGGRLAVGARHLEILDEGYGTLTKIEHRGGVLPAMALLRRAEPWLESDLPPVDSPGAPGASRHGLATILEMIRQGVVHILTGFDHLLFLVGLLAACRSFRPTVAVVTCFTVGHSVTLAAAWAGWAALPAGLVEPLIAASLIFVGLENLLRSGEPRARWLVTLAFGLIHGFGFAGALQDLQLGTGGTVAALAAFNLGVELGQLGVLALVLPGLFWLRRRPVAERRLVLALSAAVAIAGLAWLVQRTIFA